MKKACLQIFGLFLGAVIITSVIGGYFTTRGPPKPTPHPTVAISRYCVTETAARTNIALYMAQVINSDDIGVLQAITDRPGERHPKEFRDNNQVYIVQFSALKRGTGKYKKGWLYITLKDKDCSIVGHNLLW